MEIPKLWNRDLPWCYAEAVSGVSLMQETIELTNSPEEEAPALLELQEALAGPLATPICMRLEPKMGDIQE